MFLQYNTVDAKKYTKAKKAQREMVGRRRRTKSTRKRKGTVLPIGYMYARLFKEEAGFSDCLFRDDVHGDRQASSRGIGLRHSPGYIGLPCGSTTHLDPWKVGQCASRTAWQSCDRHWLAVVVVADFGRPWSIRLSQ